MAEVTNELIYEILKQLQSDVAGVKEALRETNASLNAIRIHLLGVHQDIQNMYATYPGTMPASIGSSGGSKSLRSFNQCR